MLFLFLRETLTGRFKCRNFRNKLSLSLFVLHRYAMNVKP